jgi:hypothetical protein
LELPLFAHRIVYKALLGKRDGTHRSPRASPEVN